MTALTLAAILMQQPAPPAAGMPAPEMVQVDGSTRPELVPQWSVWGYVFRILAGGPRQLPSSVARLASADEAAAIIKEADAVQKADAVCQSRLSAILSSAESRPAADTDERLHETTVECRRATLRARDRVLDGLNPAAAAALSAFAESTKAGTSITMPKRNLDRFLEPE